jgi:hypothetical protein
MSALLNRTPVLWFLFLFNAAVAIAAGAAGSHLHVHGHSLHGSQQVTTAAGMGIVALGAGAALFLRRPKRPDRPALRASVGNFRTLARTGPADSRNQLGG